MIPAPVERAEAESRFYGLAARDPLLAARLPRLFDHDPPLLVPANLAPAVWWETSSDGEATVSAAQIQHLARCIKRLHELHRPATELEALRHPATRALNHALRFDLPLPPAGSFDALLETLTPRSAAAARALRSAAASVLEVERLGRRYLREPGRPCLIHGDLVLERLLSTREQNGRSLIRSFLSAATHGPSPGPWRPKANGWRAVGGWSRVNRARVSKPRPSWSFRATRRTEAETRPCASFARSLLDRAANAAPNLHRRPEATPV